jgi:hypothetical protein
MASQQSDRFRDSHGSILRIPRAAHFRRHCNLRVNATLVSEAMVAENIWDLQMT